MAGSGSGGSKKRCAASGTLLLFHGTVKEARFSTLQDLDAGRHTEIDIFAGEMMCMGKEYEIPVPYCEYTYHMIKSLRRKKMTGNLTIKICY